MDFIPGNISATKILFLVLKEYILEFIEDFEFYCLKMGHEFILLEEN